MKDNPAFSGFETLDEYIEAKAESLRKSGVPEHEIGRRIQQVQAVQAFESAVRKLKLRYRAAHPDVDDVLVRWYGAAPVRGRAS